MSADNLRGVMLMLIAMALFAVEDMFLKWAAIGLPVGQIVLTSGLCGLPVFVWLARREGRKVVTRAALHPWVLARNIGEMVGTLAYITALAAVPLSTVSAILQALPLGMTMVAALFMQEQVGWRRWCAIAVGFAGVMLIIRPGMEGFHPQSLWVLLSVAALVLRDMATRILPRDFSTSQVSAWGLGSIALLGVMMTLAHGSLVRPSGLQTGLLAGVVMFGTAGYWAVTAASRTGEVSVVAPFRYARLIFAIGLGAVVFAERPDGVTLTGAGLIIGSGLYSFARERIRKRSLFMGAQ